MLRKYNEFVELLNVSRYADSLLTWFTDTTTSTLKEIGTDFKSVSDHEIVRAMFCFYCGCQKYKGWYPGRTQLVALLILILSHKKPSNLLLEVVTGEGKSLITALFAIVLAFQRKHVDVVTSSPILGVRDMEEWKEMYQYFGVTVSHNTDLNRPENADIDEEKFESYKKQNNRLRHGGREILLLTYSVMSLNMIFSDQTDALM